MNCSDPQLKEFMNSYHAIVPKEEFNLFDVANIKEFQHSEMLYRLLSYSVQGRHIFLESFLRRLDVKTETWSFIDADVSVSREEHIEGRPIDVLAVSGQSALIIENKCRNAGDMDKQLHDYIDNVKKKYSKVLDENLTCLYLRRIDSLDEPSDASTSDDYHAGFVTVSSYRELVVPWLKNDVLKNLPYGSGVMIASLVAYIDMLEAWSGERERMAENGRTAVELFKKCYQCQSDDQLFRTCCEILNCSENLVKDDLDQSEVKSVLHLVKTTLWQGNPFLDRWELAEQLKWMLKNNPYPFGRTAMRSRLDTGTLFDYWSIRRSGNVVMVEKELVSRDGIKLTGRIHLNCDFLLCADPKSYSTIIYGGVIGQISNMPEYNNIASALQRSLFEINGKPEEGVGFFFTVRKEVLPTFTPSESSREIIWNLADCFSRCVRTYSEILCSAGYKPA